MGPGKIPTVGPRTGPRRAIVSQKLPSNMGHSLENVKVVQPGDFKIMPSDEKTHLCRRKETVCVCEREKSQLHLGAGRREFGRACRRRWSSSSRNKNDNDVDKS